MIELYPEQQQAVDRLLTAFTDERWAFTDRSLFLSGEMGTGKTYMATSIVQHMLTEGTPCAAGTSVLIMAPSNVVTHWKNVLVLTDLDVYKFKKTDDVDVFTAHQVVLASYAQLHAVIDQFKNIADHVDDYIGMVVFDESQLIGKAACDYVADLKRWSANPLPMLFLSGTIFDTNKENLANLLMTSNPQIIAAAINAINSRYNTCDDGEQRALLGKVLSCLPIFVHFIWRYISVSVSLADVQDNSQLGTNIQQNILPINYIKLDSVQHAYYDLITARLKTMYGDKHAIRHGQIAADLIDMPSAAPLATRYNRFAYNKSTSLLALPLQAIPVKDTIKFKELLNFLGSADCTVTDKVLIYANNEELITALATALCEAGYNAASIGANANPKTIEARVNTCLQEHDIVVINPKQITVGVDVSAGTLVWYQTLTTMTAILQAQRRITRLSSTTQATVKFLAYDETAQRDLLDEISDANKNNAAAYGYKDKSNLTKLTGILLADVD